MTIATAFDTTEVSVKTIDSGRIERAKVSHVTRRIDVAARARYLLGGAVRPKAGDLVLARVTRLRQHKRLELATGRKCILFPGDEIVVSYGCRYAPDQFGAEVPKDLDECSLVAAGGMAARVRVKHKNIRGATSLSPIGLLAETRERPLNIMDGALPRREWPSTRTPILAVFGTAMNAGKTSAAAHLVKGLKRTGLSVGAAKITGTGAGNDTWLMHDAGADAVLDFTDAGYNSTFKVPVAELEVIATTLVHHLSRQRVDVIVLEIADGVYQAETRALLRSDRFASLIDSIVFAARDASGACSGVDVIRGLGYPIAAVSGALGAAPLAMEEARAETGEYVCDILGLARAEIAARLLDSALNQRRIA